MSNQLFTLSDNIEVIKKNMSEAAILEQTAEECVELAQALLKKARKLRDENYTPMTLEDIQNNLEEEFNDVLLCSMVLGLESDAKQLAYKLNRWVSRNTK